MAFITVCNSGLVALYVFSRCHMTTAQVPRELVAFAAGITFISPLLGMGKIAKFCTKLR